jgi:uncharacterized membrane-anchored protein YhcB (DUF1043 family)
MVTDSPLRITWQVWIFIAGYTIAGLIWAVRIDISQQQIMDRQANIERRMEQADNVLHNRIEQLDQHGTRRLELIESRQQDVLKRLDALETFLRTYAHPARP